MVLERNLVDRGQPVTVVASGLDNGPDHWVHLSDDVFFGGQFAEALRHFSGDVLVHIQADAMVVDMDYFLARLRFGYEQFSPGVWAPNVDYTHYRTSLVRDRGPIKRDFNRQLDPFIVDVLNTDCTCWSLNAAVVERLREFIGPEWKFGWGWDTLAAATSWSLGYRVLRDTRVTVRHPRGAGYSARVASKEFEEVKSSLPIPTQKMISLQEQLIGERYHHSGHWFSDQWHSRKSMLRRPRGRSS